MLRLVRPGKASKICATKWTGMHQTAKEIARFDLCSALVRRLELAEREIVELVEMIK
jgi:hypothetical protein